MSVVHLLMVSSLAVHLATGQTSTSKFDGAAADVQIDCAQIRLQMSQLFRQTFQKKIPVNHLNELLPLWVESTLPNKCAFYKNAVSEFNPSSQNDNRGPLGTLGPADSIFTTSLSTDWPAQRGFEAQMGGNTGQANQSWVGPGAEYARLYKGNALEDKNIKNHNFSRPKRFVGGIGSAGMGAMFGGIGGPADPGAPAREITEAEQMMNTMLMFSNLQKIFHARELGSLRKGSRSLDKPSLRNGMYGDQYYGRRRRRWEASPRSRRKRFLFGEPGDPLPINPLFDVYGMMAGTAVDPNTGKRVEFGGDAMTNLVANTYMSILPMGNPPPPGHEPPEMFRNMASAWYLNTLQNVFNPRPQQRTYTSSQIRRNGYYGDTFPGKKKKKRTVSISGEELVNGPVRSKRQAEEVKLENSPATTQQKPVAFYRNQVYYGDPLYPNGQATGYDRAMSMFRRTLLRNQKLRQQYEKQQESLYVPFGNYRNPEPAHRSNANFQQQAAPPIYVPGNYRNPEPAQRSNANFQQQAAPNIYVPGNYRNPEPAQRSNANFQQQEAPPIYVPGNYRNPEPAQRSNANFQQQVAPPIYVPASPHGVPPTQAIPYQSLPAYKPTVDPFILIPASKDNFDPFAQGLDPFIPNPTTTPAPTTTAITAEPGRRKKRSDESVSASEKTHARLRRADKHGETETPHSDFYYSLPFLGGFFANGFGQSNGFSKPYDFSGENAFGYRHKWDRAHDNVKPYKSSYIANNKEVIYGERPSWSSNGNSYGRHSGSSRNKRSEWSHPDFFYYGGYEGERGYKKEEKGNEKKSYGNGFDGQFYGDYFPWSFNGNSYDHHSEGSRYKRSDGRNHDFFYYGDHGYKEEKGKEKNSYGNGFEGQFFGDYFPWSFNGNSYDHHSEGSRYKRSDGRNHDFFYYGDHGYKKEEKGREKNSYGNGFGDYFFNGDYSPWSSNGNSNYDHHFEGSRYKRSDGRNHDFFYYGDHGYKKEEKGREKNSYGNGFGDYFFNGDYSPWSSNGNSNYDHHFEGSRYKRSDGSSYDFFYNGGYDWDRGYQMERRGYGNGYGGRYYGDRYYGDAYQNGRS